MEKYPSEEELQGAVIVIKEEIIQNPLVVEALEILDELPEYLEYHNKDHTVDDVIDEVILFSYAAGESKDVIENLVIAAAWHDTGYIERYEKNEPLAVKLFKESKYYSSLEEEWQQEIENNILDTQLKMINGEPIINQEKSKYGYLLDADTSNFGRDDFFEKRQNVIEEINLNLEDKETRRIFFEFTLKLLENHTWKTDVAKYFRQEKKDENIKKIKKELELSFFDKN